MFSKNFKLIDVVYTENLFKIKIFDKRGKKIFVKISGDEYWIFYKRNFFGRLVHYKNWSDYGGLCEKYYRLAKL